MSAPNEQGSIPEVEDVASSRMSVEDMRKKEVALKAKLEVLADVRIEGSIEIEERSTNQLSALSRSQLQDVSTEQNVGSTCRKLQFYNLGRTADLFLQIDCWLSRFYVRDGYKQLYDDVCKKWKGKHYRVCLIGNAGTGKSMFQLFALKKLLEEQENKPQYDLVIRQVDSDIYIIDLEQVAVFVWKIEPGRLRDLSGSLTRTLYFFEPGISTDRSPLVVAWPSLSTLSPYEKRIKEYSKKRVKRLYFWPWSFPEMWAVVQHSGLDLDFDEFTERYKSYGGIIRNVLGEDDDARTKLNGRKKSIDWDTLRAKELNVDRIDDSGFTVSGFLVCYNHRWNEGSIDFSKKNLEYTSLEVEDAVLAEIKDREDHVKGVLGRLGGEMIDLSGKMLENASIQLLSRGTTYKWEACKVGTNSWVKFSITMKTITRTFTIGENYTQGGLIIAPTNTNFPAVDFVFSNQNANAPVVAFQCTWNKTHPMTVRALYEFRCKQMDIPDTQIVNIYLISPMNEELYQSKTKSDFLDGSVDADLQWTMREKVPANRLKAMWNKTNIHVLSPEKSWKETLQQWLVGGSTTAKRRLEESPEVDSKRKSRPRNESMKKEGI